MDMVRCMLIYSKLSLKFWGEASKCAAYILNRLPTKPIGGGCPEEIWQQKRVSITHLRPFGCKAYFHVPHPLRHKLEPYVKQGIMVGYEDLGYGYRIWSEEQK